MAATLQQHCATGTNPTNCASNTAANPNPQLKRLVYSKYRELLGSYNNQANAYIETLPSYMVHKDTGFNLEMKNSNFITNSAGTYGNTSDKDKHEMYGAAGQRMPSQQTHEAPACIQNAMMTKDKKPFTYTPGGIDLSQIKSERMAKRLARNAQAEGATGIQQQNRPMPPQSPGGSSPSAAASMGAAAMGMPFQVLPPPPPPAPGKNFNGGSAPAPPPPPSSSNFSNTGTLAPPANGSGNGGRGSAPTSPSMPRKSPTPQHFEPPPMGFRPEIKIPPNPMAALRKVPPPVEKNTFWKDEYNKERSKSPLVELPNTTSSNNGASSPPQTMSANNNNDQIDAVRRSTPTSAANNSIPQNQTNNNFTNHQQPQQQMYTPPNTQQQMQQSLNKTIQQSPQYGAPQPPSTQQTQAQFHKYSAQQQPQQSTRPEFRSVAAPTSPAANVYTRQSDSPRNVENATPPRATESPFKFSQQQQHQQQRVPPAVSPLAQHSTAATASFGSPASSNNHPQSIPWRNQRASSQQPQAAVVAQSQPLPIYNNVQQQQQRSPDFSTQQSPYQGPKPTNVGCLYIAPLDPPTEPQAQHIVRQQMQQQQRDSPLQQMAPQQQAHQHLRWMSTQPMTKEQPAWARPEENGNVVPSSINRRKSPPPASSPSQVQQQMNQSINQGNVFMPQTVSHNFGAQPSNATGLRLQINAPINQANSQNGPKERIIPIQLEQTPTSNPTPPSFNQQQYGGGSMPSAPGYVIRTPNQFVDQGYNNFGQQHQQQHHQQQQQQQQYQQPQRVMSPNSQQLNAPRMVQQTQNNAAAANKTHIIPIAIEHNEGSRGPISKTPIVIQNDQRTPPIQSKSFRILQKITDTIDDGTSDENANKHQQHLQQQPVEPQLHRPTFARQMSAEQAHHSPTVEQMKRMQIGHEQGNYSAPTTPSALKHNKQRPFYDNNQQYIPPSEQQAAEPKKYTGSAIPSRSFKILQAMTQPENAEKKENYHKIINSEMNEIVSKPDISRHASYASSSPAVEAIPSSSSTSISSELAFSPSSSHSPTPPPSQSMPYPPYPYPYGYTWYLPPPPPHMTTNQNSENCTSLNWQYPYGMPPFIPNSENHPPHYSAFPYYYPCYPPLLPTAPLPPHCSSQIQSNIENKEFDPQTMYPSYMPPSHPYLAYPYHVAPSYSQCSNSSRASSVLPDIIITPSTDDVPSKVIMKHHIKIEKARPKSDAFLNIEDVTSTKSNLPDDGSVIDILSQQLENLTKCITNNLNTKDQSKKLYKKNIDQKSPEDNTSPVQMSMPMLNSEHDSEPSSDSEMTPKQMDNCKKVPIPLKSIKSVSNIQIYRGQKMDKLVTEPDSDTELEEDDDDETTADGESDIFDEEDELEEKSNNHEEEDSASEEFIVDDNLSVIYEEESEIEKSSKPSWFDRLSLDKEIEHKKEKIDDDNEEERDDSNSVTVRLPLKFSFTSSKDMENIATLEVGTSQIEEKRHSCAASEKRRSFNVATVKSDSEDDDCDVSVTISLTQSSKSSSLDDKVKSRNITDIYPIEDIPLPEESLQKEESSKENFSTPFDLHMRNKFASETINGGITNNVAILKNDVLEIRKSDVQKSKDGLDEMDFFASLMATKMQAQKIKEQLASLWGNSKEQSVDEPDIKEVPKYNFQASTTLVQDNIQIKENNSHDNAQSSNNTTTESATRTEKVESFGKHRVENSQDITKPETYSCCETEIEAEEINSKEFESNSPGMHKKPKFSFWDHCTTTSKSENVEESSSNEKEDQTTAEKNKSIGQQIGDIKIQCQENQCINTTTEETEEIDDIWADREEYLPPIKPIRSKLKSLDTAKNLFWDRVYEAEKQKENQQKTVIKQSERIKKVEFNISALRCSVTEICQPLRAALSFKNAEKTDHNVNQQSDAEEVDFWAEIEKERETKMPEQKPMYQDQEVGSQGLSLMSSSGKHEYAMLNDDDINAVEQEFDPLKYPEEPREVDTDEEIDFWAEIEAKQKAEEDDVSFHKSASFWASREQHNSVDETPYKPVLPKAFHAKLPNEPPTINIDIWEALEAHKGEEPLIIDPEIEEEKLLAQKYDEMAEEKLSEEKRNDETVSVHEAIASSVWCPQAQINQAENHTTAWPQKEQPKPKALNDKKKNEIQKTKIENNELDIKRSNYRKAMAFFTMSIDENKEGTTDRHERSKSISKRPSYTEETEQWDWDAVNEALQKEETSETNNKNNEITVKEISEQTVQIDLPALHHKEETNRAKTLDNGLPDLEINKFNEERKTSVKDRITAFETGAVEKLDIQSCKKAIQKQSLSVDSSIRQSSLSRNNSSQRSESEMDEDDSGVTDMNRQLSETDTESESFPELRKMSSYQRAATHSRLFKLLQEDLDVVESNFKADDLQFKPSRRKIVHNVSITRKQNPTLLVEAETMSQRRQRLSLPLQKNTSIDNDNPSTPNSPASPIIGHNKGKSPIVSDKLVCELVQSLLLKSDSTLFRNLPMEKLQAAAKIVLEEELDSLENTSVDSITAPPNTEIKRDKSYADYYNTWSEALGTEDIVPSKSFRALQDSRRSPWTARCPRVLSSKTINRDLSRVTESPEISMLNRQSRETSIGKWKKS